MDKDNHTLIVVGILGAVIGFGQLLASGDDMKVRHALGRAIVSSGLAMSAFTVLAWFPQAPSSMLVGVACLLSSLGTTGLTMLAKRIFRVPDSPIASNESENNNA